jgi:hypothetical protein
MYFCTVQNFHSGVWITAENNSHNDYNGDEEEEENHIYWAITVSSKLC